MRAFQYQHAHSRQLSVWSTSHACAFIVLLTDIITLLFVGLMSVSHGSNLVNRRVAQSAASYDVVLTSR